MRRFKRQIKNTGLAIIATAALASCGGDSGPTDPGPTRDTTNPTTSITASPNRAEEGSTINLSALYNDNTKLDQIRITFAGPSNIADTTINNPTTPQSIELRRTFNNPGNYTATAFARDTAGNTATTPTNITIEEIIIPPDSATLTFNSKYFFEQNTNETININLTGPQGNYNLNITQGTGNITIPQGNYNIKIQDPDNKWNDNSQLTYLEETGGTPGNHLVFDGQNIAQPIAVNTNKTYETVTIKEAQFLKDMAQQWGRKAKAPMPGTIKLVLYASGNPTCNLLWQPEHEDYNDCGDTTSWPPGKPMTQEQIDNFEEYVEDTKDNFNNTIIPWSPYQIESVLADSVSIQDYVSSVNENSGLAELKIPNTFVEIGTGFAPFRTTFTFLSNPIEYVVNNSATSNGNAPWLYSNEMSLFGSLSESRNYDVCSIRDHEDDGLLPECPFDETTPTYYDFDKKAHAIVATYLVRAQTQSVPFNVQLPEP